MKPRSRVAISAATSAKYIGCQWAPKYSCAAYGRPIFNAVYSISLAAGLLAKYSAPASQSRLATPAPFAAGRSIEHQPPERLDRRPPGKRVVRDVEDAPGLEPRCREIEDPAAR